MTGPDLKPCPFCGEKMPDHDDTSYIRCMGCGAESGWRATPEDVAAAWNRRDPAVLAALPEVQAMIAAAYEVAAQKTANDVVKWKARAEKAEARAVELEAALKSALNLWNRAEIQDGYILLWRDGDMIARLTFDMWNVGLEPCHQEAIVGDVLDAFQARATIKDVAK